MKQSALAPKGQELPPSTLFVVATPIGNLSDFSERARTTLADVDGILAEDTRQAQKLLNILNVKKKVLRSDEHQSSIQPLLEALRRGERWALVSDAGTPGISDPGASVVAAAREAGFDVVPVPGPCAFVALASISGWRCNPLEFVGFLPRKESEVLELFAQAQARSRPDGAFAFYESPQRIQSSLEYLSRPEVSSTLGISGMVLGKELTKIHEKVWSGLPSDLLIVLRNLHDDSVWRGEWCGLVSFQAPHAHASVAQAKEWERLLELLLGARMSSSDAVDIVRRFFDELPVSRRDIYQRALEMKK